MLHHVSAFDFATVRLLHGFVGHSHLFDKTMMKLVNLSLVKNGFFIAYLYYVWFRREGDWPGDRAFVVRAVLGVVAAVAISRLLQEILPIRPRPMFEPRLALDFPSTGRVELNASASSFPSDTTTLAISLATAMFLRNRAVGLIAAVLVLVASIAPKLYLGYHYPSDIAAGLAIGALCAITALRVPLPPANWRELQRWHDAHRGLFNAAMFIAMWQVATLFNDARVVGRGVLEMLERLSDGS